jgi:hypothetical protein
MRRRFRCTSKPVRRLQGSMVTIFIECQLLAVSGIPEDRVAVEQARNAARQTEASYRLIGE